MWRLALVAVAASVTLSGTTVKWDGMFHVPVHCDGATTCAGDITVRAPGADQSNVFVRDHYSVPAGTTKSIALDPAGSDNAKIDALSSVIVRLEPVGEQPVEATMKLDKASSNPSPTSPAPKPLGPPTKFQSVKDKRGDARGAFGGMDLVFASAQRKTAYVVFTIRTAKPPPNQHDFAGNPAAPCLRIPRSAGHAIETCGDANLRGYTMKFWPKVKFSLRGATARWTVPFKYLPKRSFKWRAYVNSSAHPDSDADTTRLLTFIR